MNMVIVVPTFSFAAFLFFLKYFASAALFVAFAKLLDLDLNGQPLPLHFRVILDAAGNFATLMKLTVVYFLFHLNEKVMPLLSRLLASPPAQSSSTPFPGTSVAPGWIPGLLSLQSCGVGMPSLSASVVAPPGQPSPSESVAPAASFGHLSALFGTPSLSPSGSLAARSGQPSPLASTSPLATSGHASVRSGTPSASASAPVLSAPEEAAAVPAPAG